MEQKKVVFIEDDEQDMRLIKLYLNQPIPEAEFLFLDNSLDLLNLFEQGVFPSIVFLDLNTPSISGQELLENTRKLYPNCTTLFFIFSSSQRRQDIIECYKLGVSGYFVKPYDINQFKSTISVFNNIITSIEVV